MYVHAIPPAPLIHGVRAAKFFAALAPHMAHMAGHHGGRRGRGRGPGPFGGPWMPPFAAGFPFGGPGVRGFGPPPWRGGKARRGDVRNAILSVLADEPRNGYQVIQEIAHRSGGIWRPSPGSIYPTLQQLEDEGLIRAVEQEGRRVFELTDEGRAYVEEHGDDLAAAWEEFAGEEDEHAHDLRHSIGQLLAAVWQVATTSGPSVQAAARDILDDARRRLYALLAEDDDFEQGTPT